MALPLEEGRSAARTSASTRHDHGFTARELRLELGSQTLPLTLGRFYTRTLRRAIVVALLVERVRDTPPLERVRVRG